MTERVCNSVGNRELSLETGRMARQAHGAVLVGYGGTTVLVTAVRGTPREGIDFFPLTIEYREKTYAAGRIPGGFFRREGRPSEKETLTARMTDRPLRPLFPDGYGDEVQIVATVVSADQENDPDLLAMTGASAALRISDLPFHTSVGAVRVGWVDGQFILNPTFSQLEESKLNIVIAGTETDVVMVEGSALEVSEEMMIDALEFGHRALRTIVTIQEELVRRVGKEKIQVEAPAHDEALVAEVERLAEGRIREALLTEGKLARQEAMRKFLTDIQERLAERHEEQESEIKEILGDIERRTVREMILKEGRRVDGRGLKDVRPITCEVGLLPRAHGSALFTRGETQALVATTLGTARDEQKMDQLQGESFKSFLLHYNFPPFSVGETKPIRGPGRREIGHGVLAERALRGMMPPGEEFPYTVRIVSDILESNGSSSMASVCGGSLALMDAGVPVKTAVAGVAVGLVKEGDDIAVLTDMTGLEDHLGNMDFKVTGTAEGITAFQMDVKVAGLSRDVMARALEQGCEARQHVLEKMNAVLPAARPQISEYAPEILQITIPVDKIGEVIGPGGKVIRDIQTRTGAQIDIDDDGTVTVSGPERGVAAKAIELIRQMATDVEVGKIYTGKVTRLMNFGAFVEVLPRKEGLVHISELAPTHVKRVEDVVNVGDEVTVKCIEIDSQNRVNLSKVAAERELGLIPDLPGDGPPPSKGRSDRRRPRGTGDRDPSKRKPFRRR